MSEEEAKLTKRDFLLMTGTVLCEFFNAAKVKNCLEVAASKVGISEPANAAAAIMARLHLKVEKAPKDTVQKRKVVDSVAKDKPKRDKNIFSLFVSYFSDYIANFGHNPLILDLRKEFPSLFGLQLASRYYNKLPQQQKDDFKRLVLETLSEVPEDEKGAGHALQALKRYDVEHPDCTLGSLVGLDIKAEYKTDPAKMKAEAATARRQAGGNGAADAAVTPAGKRGLDAMEVDGAAGLTPANPTSSAKKANKDKAKNKDKDKPAEATAVIAPPPAAAGAGPSAVHAKAADDKAEGKKRRRDEEEDGATVGEKKKSKKHKDVEVKEEVKEEEKLTQATEERRDKEKKKEKKKDKEHKEEKAEKKKDKEKEGRDTDKKEKKKDKEEKKEKRKDKEEGKDSEKKEKKKDKEKSERKSSKKDKDK